MVLAATLPLLLTLATAPLQAPGDTASAVRRIAATTALAAREYALGVSDGKVVLAPEVEEARLFLSEARRAAGLLAAEPARPVLAEIDSMLSLVNHTAAPAAVRSRARALADTLAARFHVEIEEVPLRAPVLARGAELYRAECAGCHGGLGRADGPSSESLNPAPADLTDFRALADATPLDFYRRITIGVAGTAMPSYEEQLTPEERWALALYTSTLRLPLPRGDVPAPLRDFPRTARLSDTEIASELLPGGEPASAATRARVAAVRGFGSADAPANASGEIFARVRTELDSVLRLAEGGRGEMAATAAFDAYMTFEQVERGVRARNAGLADRLEAAFAELRSRAAGGGDLADLRSTHALLLGELENAERAIGGRLSPLNLFVQSFVLLLREGLEAILVVGALITFLVKTGAGERRRDIHIGVGAALGASFLTALLLETIFTVSRAGQEALEGGVMLAATAMLFYVSYWLLSKMELAQWSAFVRGRVEQAVSGGSTLALASVAFLAVYREGFETVLFYKALFLAGAGSILPVLLGMVAGGLTLAAVYFAINRWGVRIPLKPFFAVTSAFLYYMAFVFAGQGIAELQEGGVVGTTVLPWAPRIPALGLYPTAESLGLQALLLVLLVGGLAWTFVIEPRRLRVTQVMVPDPSGPPPGTSPTVAAPGAGSIIPAERALRVEQDMLRSLERMDADLAALRAEVERLKSLLRRGSSSRSGH